jgi:hypothetical protein
MMGEMRWTPHEAQERLDGIDVATLELNSTDLAALHVIARPDVAAFLRERDEGTRLAELARTAVAASCAVGLLTIGHDVPSAWLQCGRALERVWLAAAASGLAVHPWTALPYMIAMLDGPGGSVFNEHEQVTLRELDRRLHRLFRGAPEHHRAFLFRLGYAPDPTTRSLRLPVDWVLSSGPPPSQAS